jgi:hypothetical protein
MPLVKIHVVEGRYDESRIVWRYSSGRRPLASMNSLVALVTTV